MVFQQLNRGAAVVHAYVELSCWRPHCVPHANNRRASPSSAAPSPDALVNWPGGQGWQKAWPGTGLKNPGRQGVLGGGKESGER